MRLALLAPTLMLAFFALSLQKAHAALGVSSISGKVYNDVNANGVIDTGEVALGNITVSLYNSQGSLVGQTTTSPGGGHSYTFTTLADGITPLPNDTYTVVVVVPAGYTATNSIAGLGGVKADNTTIKVVVNTPTDTTIDYTPQNFLITQTVKKNDKGAVNGHLYCDDNRDCVFSAGDDTLAGVTVTLQDSTKTTIATTTTDANGAYSFANLADGTYYVLVPSTANGLKAVAKSATISISGGNTVTRDFAYRGGAISGYVFCDKDQDGYKDCNEKGISGVTVTLKDCNGNVIETKTTDCNGYYIFNDCLAAGSYQVCVKKCLSTTKNKSGGDDCNKQGDKDDSDDYNCRVDTTSCIKVTLCAGQSSTCNNFGFYKSCNISGCIKGEHDCDDKKFSCVTVILKDCEGEEICRTTTDKDGHYCFKQCDEGDYRVCITKNCKTHSEDDHEKCDKEKSSDDEGECNRTYSGYHRIDVSVCSGDKNTGNDFKYKKKCN